MPVDFLKDGGQQGDQHRSPPRQHALRQRQPGRRRRLLHRRDRLRPGGPARGRADPEIASALYVALVTDTGKFMYENTDARSHRMAAGLIEAGVEVNDVYRRLYEHAPIEKLKLLARALERIELLDDGASRRHLHLRRRLRRDRRQRGPHRGHHRPPAHASTARWSRRSCATRRDGGRAARKVSMRSTDGRVDVSAIARVHGGGGHRRAAGFGDRSALRAGRRVPDRRDRLAARELTSRGRRGADPRRGLLVDKPAGVTSHDVVGGDPARARRQGRPRGHARPVRDRAA